MTPERWQRVKELFETALAQEPAVQVVFLAGVAPDDPSLAEEVRRLLASDEKAGAFLSTPPNPASVGFVSSEAFTVSVGRHIGPYRILTEIAQGGMGAVYRAVRDDDQYQKQVAIKLVRGGMGSDFVIERFKAERQILANLEHPNIARLIDGGTTEEGWPWFSMEYVEGRPIDAYCASRGLSTRQRLELFRTVCSAVQYAHQRLVIHRDLKPSNILVTEDGTPKLLDFGIAKLLSVEPGQQTTLTGLPLMTPEYASPEQVRGHAITTASDVYSLGVLLYELLSGVRPYQIRTGSPEEIAQVVCEVEPEPPSAMAPQVLARQLAGDIDTIVLKALRKEPARRYPSVHELAEDIRRHLEGFPVTARKDTLRYRAGKFVRRHNAAVVAAGVVAFSLVAGIVATARQARIAEANRARAERRFNDVRKLANSFLFEFHDAIKDLPGAMAARALVVKKALEYLDGLAQEAAGDRSLQRELAAAYDKVGDVQGQLRASNLGDTQGARASYRKALALREALAAADPQDRDARGDLSVSYGKIGDMLWTTGDVAAALEMNRKSLALDLALVEEDPATEARQRLAARYSMFGLTLGASGDSARGMENLRKALALFEALSAAAPGDVALRDGMAKAYSRMGEILGEVEPIDKPAALVMHRKALAIDEKLAAADPLNASLRFGLAADHSLLGDVEATIADTSGALADYRMALELAVPLSKADPSNGHYRSALGYLHQRLGSLQAQLGELPAAMANLREALAIHEPELAADPSNATARTRVAMTSEGLGTVHVRLASIETRSAGDRIRDWREARLLFQRAWQVWEDLRKNGSTTGEDAARPAGLAREMAKCDAALARLGAKP